MWRNYYESVDSNSKLELYYFSKIHAFQRKKYFELNMSYNPRSKSLHHQFSIYSYDWLFFNLVIYYVLHFTYILIQGVTYARILPSIFRGFKKFASKIENLSKVPKLFLNKISLSLGYFLRVPKFCLGNPR